MIPVQRALLVVALPLAFLAPSALAHAAPLPPVFVAAGSVSVSWGDDAGTGIVRPTLMPGSCTLGCYWILCEPRSEPAAAVVERGVSGPGVSLLIAAATCGDRLVGTPGDAWQAGFDAASCAEEGGALACARDELAGALRTRERLDLDAGGGFAYFYALTRESAHGVVTIEERGAHGVLSVTMRG